MTKIKQENYVPAVVKEVAADGKFLSAEYEIDTIPFLYRKGWCRKDMSNSLSAVPPELIVEWSDKVLCLKNTKTNKNN